MVFPTVHTAALPLAAQAGGRAQSQIQPLQEACPHQVTAEGAEDGAMAVTPSPMATGTQPSPLSSALCSLYREATAFPATSKLPTASLWYLGTAFISECWGLHELHPESFILRQDPTKH